MTNKLHYSKSYVSLLIEVFVFTIKLNLHQLAHEFPCNFGMHLEKTNKNERVHFFSSTYLKLSIEDLNFS